MQKTPNIEYLCNTQAQNYMLPSSRVSQALAHTARRDEPGTWVLANQKCFGIKEQDLGNKFEVT